MNFPLHSADTAPPAAAAMLKQTEEAFGMVPNLERTMATAPAMLEAYAGLWERFQSCSLRPVEQQVVYQTINVEHGCTY